MLDLHPTLTIYIESDFVLKNNSFLGLQIRVPLSQLKAWPSGQHFSTQSSARAPEQFPDFSSIIAVSQSQTDELTLNTGLASSPPSTLQSKI